MRASSKILPFPQSGAEVWIDEYQQAKLVQKDAATIDVCLRILRQFSQWVVERPGHGRHFELDQLAQASVELYLSLLKEQGCSVSHRMRVKSVINHFCPWLIEDKEVLRRNPTHGVEVRVQQLSPRILSPDQCFVVGHKGEKFRDSDLLNKARRPLYDYLRRGGRDLESRYAFPSQRHARLTEAGIHHWFRGLKRQANTEQWELVVSLSFHDLRHDFAHREPSVPTISRYAVWRRWIWIGYVPIS